MVKGKVRSTSVLTCLSFSDDASEIFQEIISNRNPTPNTEILEDITTKIPASKDSVTRSGPSAKVAVTQPSSTWEAFVNRENDSNMETSVPPSVLFQSPDNASESGHSVKVKRTCGRPRNPIPRHKRISHLSAENRRRGKIQDAFQSLKDLVPRQSHYPGRVSKADILSRAVDECQELESDIQDLKSTMHSLQTEKEALSLDIKAHKALLREKDSADQQPAPTLDDLYAGYVQERCKSNPCFRIFALMLSPLFESFKMAVKDKSAGQFLAAIWDWAFIHFTLPNLREGFVKTNNITAGSDTVRKDLVHELNDSMPTYSHCTNSFPNSLSVFKTKSCLQSTQGVEILSAASENERLRKDFPVDSQLDSVSHAGYQSVASVCTNRGSPCFAVDAPNGCVNSEVSACGSHKFQTRCPLNDNQNSSDEIQLNSCSSFYQNVASERPQLNSKNSNNPISTPLLQMHHGIKNKAPFLPSSPATISEDTISVDVNQIRGPLAYARLPGKSDRPRFKNITRVRSSHEPCRQTKNIDHYPKDHINGKSPTPYGIQIQRPSSLPFPPEDQIKHISGFLDPKINQSQSFVHSPMLPDNLHHSGGSYFNSHVTPTIVETNFHDLFHNSHTVAHLSHERPCLRSPSSLQSQIDQCDSSNRSQKEYSTLHQELSPDSPSESTPYHKFSFLNQLLGTPNFADQGIDASAERSKESSFVSGVMTATAYDTDRCQISPSERSKFYQPVSSLVSNSSLFSSLYFTPEVNRSSGRRSCRFPDQRKPCQRTLTPPQPIQYPSPDPPSFMPFTQISDQVFPGVHDNMWSMTRSDQVISPFSDDATQHELTSPSKTAHAGISLGQIHGLRGDSLNHRQRTFKMKIKTRQGNELSSSRTSPLTYINMDADQIVVADERSNEKQLFQLTGPLGGRKGSCA